MHLPKFELEESYDLKSDLAAMGLLDIFDSAKADLSGMSGAHDLFLSEIVHKAFVEVNEEGTEAAAATAGIAMLCMIIEEDFNADHPFLFFIRHNPTQSILFFGRYASPWKITHHLQNSSCCNQQILCLWASSILIQNVMVPVLSSQ